MKPAPIAFGLLAALAAIFAAIFLTGCATNPDTGKRTLSPQALAAADRLGNLAVTTLEMAIAAKLNETMRVHPSGK